MTDLDRALTDIQNIRQQAARSVEFRGYGPATLAISSAIALLTGLLQARWVPEPAAQPERYVALWLGTAVLCGGINAAQMYVKARRSNSSVMDSQLRSLATAFLPSVITGAALPVVLLVTSPESAWLLPGLWQIIFSLGVFATCRSLPRPMLLVGAWFLTAGLVSVSLGSRALAPACMADVFAVGMLSIAVIHFVDLRRGRVHEDEEL